MADAVHEEGAAIMTQISNLGRRTRWDKDDWLPAISPSLSREPSHRAFPKRVEEWEIEVANLVYARPRSSSPE